LRFSCQGCNGCCHIHGENRWVYLTARELKAMAAALDLRPAEFGQRYCLKQGGQQALRFASPLCPLHDGKGCRVYQARPLQCATWPFWPENLYSRRAWATKVAAFCPGADQGRLWTGEEIKMILQRQR
jgi:uncharacterized protein